MSGTILLVVAKAPVAGLAKTRLCPPATPVQAARIAAASLLRTLRVVLDVPGVRPVVAMTGDLAAAEDSAELRRVLRAMTVIPQRGESFGDRLAHAHQDSAAIHRGLPVVQIGMDTPQVSRRLLADAAGRMSDPAGPDSVLGPATDGGWWALGLRDPLRAAALRAVPMSRPDTGTLTAAAVSRDGRGPEPLAELSDVDTMAVARDVAGRLPGTRFARAVDEVVDGARQPTGGTR